MSTSASFGRSDLDHEDLDPLATQRRDRRPQHPKRPPPLSRNEIDNTLLADPPPTRSSLPATTSASPTVSPPDPQPLSGDLIDALIEAVVLPSDPSARSVVVCSLIRELCAALAWLDGDETSQGQASDEALSIQQLASAARDHHLRMTRSEAPTGKGTKR